MGLFSARDRLGTWRRAGRLPVRLLVVARAAVNDARVVCVFLVLAALALAVEMAASFHAI
jgi:hypothetical protein